MDFDQLATFVFVAKLKSFSRAGQKVFRSQSAVSAQIRQLEQAYKARLLDRSAAVAIVTLPIKSPNLKMHHIYKDRLRFMVSSRNPLAHRSKITLAEVAEQPLIFPRTGFTRQVLDKLFRPYRSRLHVTMELPSIGMIKRFVAADAGVSFISESFAKDQVKAGEVKLLTVEGVDLWRELGLVYRRDRSLPRAAQALIAMIREHRKAAEPAEAVAS